MSKAKRSKLEIIKEILGAILLNRKIVPTRLMYKSNLSPLMFKEYTNKLIEKDLIKKTIILKGEIMDGKKVKCDKSFFNLTELGREYLEDYKAVQMFLEKYGLNEEE